jgi:hypothetical protein
MQLYKISFTTTPKVYIGITSKTAKLRLCQHKYNKLNTAISKAIKKHGNPMLTVLAECNSWELLCLAEQEAIEKFNSKSPNGYNLTDGGEGNHGRMHTEYAKKIISIKGKNRFKKEDELLKNSERMKHYCSLPGIKERMSNSAKISHKKNPMLAFNQSNKIKEYFKNNIDKEIERALKIKKYWSFPENKIKQKLWQQTGWAIKKGIASKIN